MIENFDGHALISVIDARIRKLGPEIQRQNPAAFKSEVVSTSSGITTKRAGESSGGSVGKLAIMPQGLIRPKAGRNVLEQLTGNDSAIAGEIIATPDYRNQYWFIPSPYPETTTTTNVGSANQVRFFRFNLTVPIIVSRILFTTPTGATGVNFSVAIYNSAGTERLITTGAMTENINQNKDVVDVSLCTGPYICAYTADDTAVTFRACQMSTDAITALNSFAPQIGTAATASASGACPASLGVLTGASINFPLVVLQG